MELESMTALELAAKIRQREVSVLDGVKEVFDQIESKEDKVHAYLDTYKRTRARWPCSCAPAQDRGSRCCARHSLRAMQPRCRR